MGMPNDLVLVRHGQSEGNIATNAAEKGDHRFYTDAFTTTPGHQWRLTDVGRMQAELIGGWIGRELGYGTAPEVPVSFDRYYVSPFVRTRETAAHLGLPNARWLLNRALRERDWGDIGTLRKDEFETLPHYRENFWMKEHDPLYWSAPNGESIAQWRRTASGTFSRRCTGSALVSVYLCRPW